MLIKKYWFSEALPEANEMTKEQMVAFLLNRVDEGPDHDRLQMFLENCAANGTEAGLGVMCIMCEYHYLQGAAEALMKLAAGEPQG